MPRNPGMPGLAALLPGCGTGTDSPSATQETGCIGTRTTSPRRPGIASLVFIGLGLRLLVGVFLGEAAAFLRIGGDIFIAALQITVIPYVVVALVTSLGRLTLDQAKAPGSRHSLRLDWTQAP
ncbi:MAG: cation:dicarboxylase symporter family transporter [Gammaproteobacteria bacterium]